MAPLIAIGVQAASILIPLAIDMLSKGKTTEGVVLTQEQINELRALVDKQHEVIQALEG